MIGQAPATGQQVPETAGAAAVVVVGLAQVEKLVVSGEAVKVSFISFLTNISQPKNYI